jgi:hypothetical protein
MDIHFEENQEICLYDNEKAISHGCCEYWQYDGYSKTEREAVVEDLGT